MNHEKAGGYISRITFNNGESLDISRDDIVIFVGPNNAGKSQSLTLWPVCSIKQSFSVKVIRTAKCTPLLKATLSSGRENTLKHCSFIAAANIAWQRLSKHFDR